MLLMKFTFNLPTKFKIGLKALQAIIKLIIIIIIIKLQVQLIACEKIYVEKFWLSHVAIKNNFLTKIFIPGMLGRKLL